MSFVYCCPSYSITKSNHLICIENVVGLHLLEQVIELEAGYYNCSLKIVTFLKVKKRDHKRALK